MSLRKRLILTVMSLLTVGMLVDGTATFGAFFDWRAKSDDRLMSRVGRETAGIITARSSQGGRPRLPATDGDLQRMWHAGAQQGALPSYIQVSAPDGRVLQSLELADTPPIPA